MYKLTLVKNEQHDKLTLIKKTVVWQVTLSTNLEIYLGDCELSFNIFWL